MRIANFGAFQYSELCKVVGGGGGGGVGVCEQRPFSRHFRVVSTSRATQEAAEFDAIKATRSRAKYRVAGSCCRRTPESLAGGLLEG